MRIMPSLLKNQKDCKRIIHRSYFWLFVFIIPVAVFAFYNSTPTMCSMDIKENLISFLLFSFSYYNSFFIYYTGSSTKLVFDPQFVKMIHQTFLLSKTRVLPSSFVFISGSLPPNTNFCQEYLEKDGIYSLPNV